ncbi:MAG: PspA/IM30 family protein [Spirochaetota bacterium]
MEDDFDLEGLSKEEARSYVAQFVQSLQLVRKQRAEKEADFERWKSRTRLAADRGDTELAKEALRRAEEVQSALAGIKREERELDFKVNELKRRLQNIHKEPEFTVNADALLEQLRSVVGEGHETNEKIAETEAELALEELRKKMADEADG